MAKPYTAKAGLDDGDQLLLALTEVRHLKQTIIALRDEMEHLRFDNASAAQEAVADANLEIMQLRESTSTMRDELEKMHFDKVEAVQSSLKDGKDEVVQLQKTIQAMADELGKMISKA